MTKKKTTSTDRAFWFITGGVVSYIATTMTTPVIVIAVGFAAYCFYKGVSE